MYAAGAGDGAFLDWRYLNGATVAPGTGLTQATINFTAPVAPGQYEFRFFANDGFARLATSTAVDVVQSPAALVVNGVAPPTAASAAAGTIVTVDVSNGPANAADWVGFYAVGTADGASLSFKYLNNATTQPVVGSPSALLTFQVPGLGGSYEFRFFVANSFTRLATSTTLVVSAPNAQLAVNNVTPPTGVTVAGGSIASVGVSNGPANQADWVALYPAGAPANGFVDWRYLSGTTVPPEAGVSSATVMFSMPVTGGAYEFRFLANGGFDQLATSSPITVLPPTAQIGVNGVTPPEALTVNPGDSLTVQVTGGPGNASDWMALTTAGAPNATFLAWSYLNGTQSAPASGLTSATLSFTLPPAPGTYELRLFAGNGFARLATSGSVIASSAPPTASVQLTAPFPGTIFFAPASIAVTAIATATNGTIARVDFFSGPALIGSDSTTPYEINWASPALGSHVLTAVAVDNTNAVTTSPAVPITVGDAGDGFGFLGPPILNPPSGLYGPGLTVALSGAQGTTIRYATDGSFPDESSPIYTGPIAVTGLTSIRARAFQAGWEASFVATGTYQIDTEPPVIRFTLSPAANPAGWNTTPTTVSFICTDPSGVHPVARNQSWLPSTALLSQQRQWILHGNQSPESSITVRIDSVAPTISLSSPNNGTTTDPQVALVASISDALSQVATARCNGEAAPVTNGQLTCMVALAPGLNAVVLSVLDGAGNSATAGRQVVREGTATILAVTPASRTLVIGESTALTATSEFGVTSSATWVSSNPAIASVSQQPPFAVTAHAVGETTITASVNGLSAGADIRVVATGGAGTNSVRWSIPSVPGLHMQTPLLAQRIETGGPDLFDIHTFPGQPGIVRAVRQDGSLVWTASVSDGFPAFADSYGGLVYVNHSSPFSNTSLTRLTASATYLPWTFATEGHVGRPAQARDGTIFVIETVPTGGLSGIDTQAYVVALNGETGATKFRVAIPSRRHREFEGALLTSDVSAAPTMTGPIIGPADEAYVVLIDGESQWKYLPAIVPPCNTFPCPPVPQYHKASGSGTYSARATLRLMRVNPDGSTSFTTIDEISTSGSDTPTRVYDQNGYPVLEISRLMIQERSSLSGSSIGTTSSSTHRGAIRRHGRICIATTMKTRW